MELKQNEIIQLLRRRVDMNQGTLGSKAFNASYESGRTKIKNIELGKQVPTQDDLEKLAAVLGVKPQDLNPGKKAPASSSSISTEGLVVHQKTLDRFPQLRPYLDMLNKAVALDDSELMEYISEKLAAIFSDDAGEKDKSAVNR
jgi:transcriptional regulator with XRE-family HTH domain